MSTSTDDLDLYDLDDDTSREAVENPRLHDSTSAHLPGVKAPSTTQCLASGRVDLDRRVPAVHVWRDFRATPAQLMRAHTDAELFARWIGPHDVTVEIDAWDCRTLGSYRYVLRRGDESYAFRGTYPEIGERRIVQTFCYESWPGAIYLETVTFSDLGDGRTRLHGFSLCDSFEGRDALVASGMRSGDRASYQKLDRLLALGVVPTPRAAPEESP